jgi:tetratricopeptide (TPR) repeat protein
MKISCTTAITIFLLLSPYLCFADDAWAALITRTNSAVEARDYAQAEQLADETLQLFENKQEDKLDRLIYTLYNTGEIYHAQTKFPQAEHYYKKAYELALKSENDNPALPRMHLCERLGVSLLDNSKLDEAESTLRSCVNKVPPASFDRNDFRARIALIDALLLKRQFVEAESIARDQLQYVQKTLPENSMELADSLSQLSSSIQKQDLGRRLNEATSYMRQALSLCLKLAGENDLKCAEYEDNLGELLVARRELDDAEQRIQHALSVRKLKLGDNNAITAATKYNLARLYFVEDRYEEAVPLLQNVLTVFKATFGPKSGYLLDAVDRLARCYRKLGKDKEANRLERDYGVWQVR